MSLVVNVISPEGIILAADSRLTITHQLTQDVFIPNSFDTATKLLSFDKPHNYVAAATFGASTIGQRPAHSFIREFQATLPNRRITVKQFSKKLLVFYKQKWSEASIPEGIDELNFYIAGFDEGEVYGESYSVAIPSDTQPQKLIEKEKFNVAWGGQNQVVQRVVNGIDPELQATIVSEPSFDEATKSKLVEILQGGGLNFPVNFYTLQDCIELARFLINTTTVGQNLSLGIRGVGGEVDVACITTQGGFTFVKKKELQ
jgi:hypothetical protein